MDLGLKGQVAMLTGASQGIARASAYALAAEGVNVSICARHLEPLEAVAVSFLKEWSQGFLREWSH